MQPGKRRKLDIKRKWARLLEQAEQLKASVRAKVEHPFHVVKNLFSHRKVRYKGLDKNEAQLFSLFGLASLVIAKRHLLAWWVEDDRGLARRLTLPELVGDANQDAAMLTANSPVQLASRIRAPLLLAHGAEDRRVPIAHATRMRVALKAAGHPPEWISYPEEGHGFGKLENRLDFARRVDAFLARHLLP